jgi:hypothetical protein
MVVIRSNDITATAAGAIWCSGAGFMIYRPLRRRDMFELEIEVTAIQAYPQDRYPVGCPQGCFRNAWLLLGLNLHQVFCTLRVRKHILKMS